MALYWITTHKSRYLFTWAQNKKYEYNLNFLSNIEKQTKSAAKQIYKRKNPAEVMTAM